MHNFAKRNAKCFPLHIAAQRGNLKLSKYTIMDIIVDNIPRYLIGEMQFHWAAQEGHYKLCSTVHSRFKKARFKKESRFKKDC